jgi:2-methylcitrate dehydratase PrpD
MFPSAFLHDLRSADIPISARNAALNCLIDTLGVGLAARQTKLSQIIHDHAARHFGGGRVRLWQDGRTVSPTGAALANGMTIDAVDAHDGHKLTKGHVGCGVVPSLLALTEEEGDRGAEELLTALVVGYEIGVRAGISLHATVSDYHTSGAWVALATAALGARSLGLDHAQTREALGIAEYHGPRSQMMRCIDAPSMVKDGSGWGAMAGVSAAYLAADGFTGAPALTVESGDVACFWQDLGSHWMVAEQYVKLYPVCRWAQPSVEAVLGLMDKHAFSAPDIARIEITSFHEATRLAVRRPVSTEEAQYSLPFPVAAAAVRGTLGVQEIDGQALVDPLILALSDRIEMREAEDYNAAFPGRRIAHATIELGDGRVLSSPPTEAKGDPESAIDTAGLDAKFLRYAEGPLGTESARHLLSMLRSLANGGGVMPVLEALAEAPPAQSFDEIIPVANPPILSSPNSR